MTNKVQRKKPSRTCTKKYKNYRSYKEYLRDDFNKRCGYCDDDDAFMGGARGFHVDHFKPKKHFEHLITDYSNLVYCCPFCNSAKSDTWKEPEGFINPCSKLYDENLYRDKRGRIIHFSDQGEFIINKLRLWLKRHELIWLIGKLEKQKKELNSLLDSFGDSEDYSEEVRVLREFRKIQNIIDHYYNLYKADI